MNGEEAWASVYQELLKAKMTIHMCFWSIQAFHELLRPKADTYKSVASRQKYTLLHVLDTMQSKGVTIRILIWNLNGFAMPDRGLILRGIWGKYQLIFQRYHMISKLYPGSWHQKTIIVDDDLAFVGGMNAKELDWDTHDHAVFEQRRNPHKLSGSQRKQNQNNKSFPKFKPRRDFMARIEGDAVKDVQSNFAERWNYCIKAKYSFSNRATRVAVKNAKSVSGMQTQISRTMPKYKPTPKGKTEVWQSYIKAIGLAKKYIYIEDQYFRSNTIVQAVVNACILNKKLVVIIVTPPTYLTKLKPGEKWKLAQSPATYWTHKSFKMIKAVRPNFVFYFLQTAYTKNSPKVLFQPIDIHSKIMIIDDLWYTIGSANVHDRGMFHDGELNVSVQNAASAKALRKKVFSNNLNVPCPDDLNKAINLWTKHSRQNFLAWKQKKQPLSKIFPYNSVGPCLPYFPLVHWL